MNHQIGRPILPAIAKNNISIIRGNELFVGRRLPLTTTSRISGAPYIELPDGYLGRPMIGRAGWIEVRCYAYLMTAPCQAGGLGPGNFRNATRLRRKGKTGNKNLQWRLRFDRESERGRAYS